MTRTFITATVTAALLGTSVLAGPVEDFVAQLTAEGYSQIEVERKGDVTEIEARLNGMEREIKLSATGEVLSDETEARDADDGQGEDDDDREDDNDDDDKA